MIAMGFPDTFLGHPLIMLVASWALHFAGGKRMSNLVRPEDMPEAVAACQYYDELTPELAWDKTTTCYKIRRRTV